MSQQKFVTTDDGSVYEFDEFSGKYVCIHENKHVETTEVDAMQNGEHTTRPVQIALCDNPLCGEDVSEFYDFEPDYDD